MDGLFKLPTNDENEEEVDDGIEVEESHEIVVDDDSSFEDTQGSNQQEDMEGKRPSFGDDERVEDYVHRLKQAQEKQGISGGTVGFMAAALATSAAVKFASLIDEDDIMAGTAAIAQVFGGGGGGGGAAATTTTLPVTHTVVFQQMAVGAAQNASGAVATGASGAVAVGGGGAAAAAGSASSTTQTAAGATVVTAVAAGVAAATLMNGVPLLCPNVPNPSLFRGQMAVDFLGMNSHLSLQQAGIFTSRFLDTYDEIFGCDSLYSRKMVNCSLLCDAKDPMDNATMCCEALTDENYGDYHRCSFTCFVHCDGCLESEPFFAEATPPLYVSFPNNETLSNSTETTDLFSNNATLRNNISDTDERVGQRFLQQVDEIEKETDCSSICIMARAMEELVCDNLLNETENCLVFRSFAVLQIQIEEESDVGDLLTLIPLPTFHPSSTPSITPSFSPTEVPSVRPTSNPSSLPSTVPSTTPSTSPTLVPTSTPSAKPSTQPSRFPTAIPSDSPSSEPTTQPSESPTTKPSRSPSMQPSMSPTESRPLRDLIFRDEDGALMGSVDQTTLLSESVASGVTVQAIVTSEVTSVYFFLDSEFVFHDRWRPFYLWGESDDIGFVYFPLTEPGTHEINAVATNRRVEIDQRIFRYTVV